MCSKRDYGVVFWGRGGLWVNQAQTLVSIAFICEFPTRSTVVSQFKNKCQFVKNKRLKNGSLSTFPLFELTDRLVLHTVGILFYHPFACCYNFASNISISTALRANRFLTYCDCFWLSIEIFRSHLSEKPSSSKSSTYSQNCV